MKAILTVSAVIELAAGLALLCCPSATVAILVGAPLDAPAALTVARVGGSGLLALTVACWLARGDIHSRAARGLIVSMLLYDIAAAAILAYAGISVLACRSKTWIPCIVLPVLKGDNRSGRNAQPFRNHKTAFQIK